MCGGGGGLAFTVNDGAKCRKVEEQNRTEIAYCLLQIVGAASETHCKARLLKLWFSGRCKFA